MPIDEIQKAIRELSFEDLEHLREWLDEYYAELWDRQIEADAKAGLLDNLIAEVEQEALIEERRNEPERPLREYLKEKKN